MSGILTESGKLLLPLGRQVEVAEEPESFSSVLFLWGMKLRLLWLSLGMRDKVFSPQ